MSAARSALAPETLLLPLPRRIERTPAALALAAARIAPGPGVPLTAVRELGLALERARIPLDDGGAPLRLALDADLSVGPEGYALAVGEHEVRVAGRDAAGLVHGVRTLAQWLDASPPDGRGRRVPGLRVQDEPAFPVRGVLLDVSRDKVPTQATLLALIERLAAWKVNHIELYFEHTFAYRGHEVVSAGASPLTPDDVRALDARCAERGIELVPCQESLGHFHRWLVHAPYRALAECPEGLTHPFSAEPEPYGLCPVDPRSLALVADLYDQLGAAFTSRRIHAGLDETLDLGRGRSAAAVAERGAPRVYLDYVRAVHALLAERGRQMLLWADVLLEHPASLAALPRDAVAVVWGYEAQHDFAADCAPFAEAGIEHWVCPGTSSWNSLTGRTSNALANVARAARDGRASGARGLVVADWGDHGHWQPLPIAYPGLAAAAALAWNPDDPRDLRAALPALLDAHVLEPGGPGGPGGTGRALCALGDAHLAAGVATQNAAVAFLALHLAGEPLPHARLPGLSQEGLRATRAALAAAVSALPAAAPLEEARRTALELGLAATAADVGCELALARLAAGGAPCAALPPAVRGVLAERLALVEARHAELWLARNRPGGLAASCARFARIRARLTGA